ncbi:CBS domain-containing protein [Hypericibacter sp.]|uniref:CBS domain-containing protein n=1 Tax=Hypericibacter sp. TaxID=2705401 RepID=UPI003D6D8B34
MTVQTFMTSPPLSLRPDDSVGAAAQQLIENRFVNLPVADRDGIYLGVFGVFDLLALVLPKAALDESAGLDLGFLKDDVNTVQDQLEEARFFRIGDHLKKTAPVLHPESGTLEAVLELYRARNTLAVVEKNGRKLVGMVSYWDALRALMRQR